MSLAERVISASGWLPIPLQTAPEAEVGGKPGADIEGDAEDPLAEEAEVMDDEE